MFSYEVEHELAELSNTGSNAKRLTITSWSNSTPKLDLRNWIIEESGEKPGKGITLTDAEARTLVNALQTYLESKGV